MENLKNHAAVRLGCWLKATRQERGIVKRLFAGEICLTASKYSEVEAGVCRWIQSRQEKAIHAVLELAEEEIAEFKDLLTRARKAVALTFDKLFLPEQLEPIRCRRKDSFERPSETDKQAILAAVFSPIA
jgi:transcriptional regulator with XRE-family HTH domain